MKTVAVLVLVTAFNLNIAQVNTRYSPGHPESEDPCKDSTYCTVKPKNYPQEKFNKLFKNHKVLPQPALVSEVKFESRIATSEESDNCEAEVTYEPLYQVREKRENAWRLAIQVPEIGYQQRIRLERCKNPDGKCFTAFSPLPEYVTFCKQKYIAWEVRVAKGDNETELIKPLLPICCSCHYKPLSFLQRIGGRN